MIHSHRQLSNTHWCSSSDIIVAPQRSVSRLSQLHLQNLKILFRRIGHVKLHTRILWRGVRKFPERYFWAKVNVQIGIFHTNEWAKGGFDWTPPGSATATSTDTCQCLHYGDVLSCATCRVYKRSQKPLYRLKPPHPPFFNTLSRTQTVLDLMLISRWKTNSSPPFNVRAGKSLIFLL